MESKNIKMINNDMESKNIKMINNDKEELIKIAESIK